MAHRNLPVVLQRAAETTRSTTHAKRHSSRCERGETLPANPTRRHSEENREQRASAEQTSTRDENPRSEAEAHQTAKKTLKPNRRPRKGGAIQRKQQESRRGATTIRRCDRNCMRANNAKKAVASTQSRDARIMLTKRNRCPKGNHSLQPQ